MFVPVCAFCGAPAGECREQIGWAHPRSAGGLNHLEFRQETGRRICDRCYADMRAGVAPNSPRLFA
jgi:hypothetical protein